MQKDDIVYEFLSRLNSAIKRRVRITLLGGNVLSFLEGVNYITDDVDVCVSYNDKDVKQFCIEYLKKYKVPVHFFVDGLFVNVRVKDYFEKAYPLDLPEFSNLEVRALNLYDVVLTKIDRYSTADQAALELIIKHYELDKGDLDTRFKQYLKFYMGPKDAFVRNYEDFMKKMESMRDSIENE